MSHRNMQCDGVGVALHYRTKHKQDAYTAVNTHKACPKYGLERVSRRGFIPFSAMCYTPFGKRNSTVRGVKCWQNHEKRLFLPAMSKIAAHSTVNSGWVRMSFKAWKTALTRFVKFSSCRGDPACRPHAFRLSDQQDHGTLSGGTNDQAVNYMNCPWLVPRPELFFARPCGPDCVDRNAFRLPTTDKVTE